MGRKLDTLLKGFIAAKCLTLLNLTTSRIKVSRNRKSIAVRQLRGEIAQLLRSGQDTHVYDTKINSLMREENTVAVYDLIDHFCHSIISQFPVIETQRYCPPNLKEPIASLIYAAPRCVELPELAEVKDMLTTKYGKEFAIAADEIRPECGVSRQIIELLSMRPATEQMRAKLMKEICLQNNIEWRSEWTPVAAGSPLMKPPSDFLDASSQMVGAKVDIRRAARDEGIIKAQRAEPASSSIRSSNVDQDIMAHSYRGLRHGDSNSLGRNSIPGEENVKARIRVSEGIDEPYRQASPGFGQKRDTHPKEEVKRANTRVSEGMNEPYNPVFGPKRSAQPKEEVTRANTRVSEGMDEPYNPGFDPKHSVYPNEDVTRANMRVFERVDEPYNPGFGPKRSSLPKEEVKRSDMRVSEEPYDTGFDPKCGSFPKGEVTRANMRRSEDMDEPYNPTFGPKHSSLHREEVTRANMKVSEGIIEPNRPNASSGSYKFADYNQEVREDRAEYRTQHQDEISDSGSEVFVSVEDDEVALSHKEAAVRTYATKISFQGDAEDHTSNSSLRVPSLRASRETSFSREGTHRSNSLRASDSSDPLKEDDEFASTAKAIAAEAARLAVLDYARRCSRSRSGSISMDLGDLIDDGLDSILEKTVYPKTCVGEDDDGRDRNKEFRRDLTKERLNKPAADHKNDDISPMEFTYSGKSGGHDAVNHARMSKYEYSSPSSEKEKDELDSIFERQAFRKPGEKPQFDYQRQHDSVNVRTSFDYVSAPTYGRNKYNVQGKAAESPRSEQATYKPEPYNVGSSTPEKRPLFDDPYKESPYRNKFSQETSDQMRQHQSSSRFKDDEPYFNKKGKEEELSYPNQMPPRLRKNSDISNKPPQDEHLVEESWNHLSSASAVINERTAKSPTKYGHVTSKDNRRQHMTSKDRDDDQKYAKDRDWDANEVGYGNHSIRAGPRQQSVTESDDARHEETTAEVRRRHASSPVKWSIQNQEATEKDSRLYEKKRVEKVQGNIPSAANFSVDGHNKSRRSSRSPQQQQGALEDIPTKEGQEQGHAMSKMTPRMTHQRAEKNIVDEVLSAKWHAGGVTAKVEDIQSYERSSSSSRGTEGGYAAQNKSHEPATRNKPLAHDSDMGKRTPLRQQHREREQDLLSMYMPHGPIDDLAKKVPASSMSVRPPQQSPREEVQATGSSYKPYGGAIRPRQEEQKTPSMHQERNQQNRQGKRQGEQDSWPEKERPQTLHGEPQKPTSFTHQKPTSFTSADRRKHEDADNTGMSPRLVNEPPARRPPPLPQSNTPTGAGWAKQHPLSQDPRKDMRSPEKVGPHRRNDSANLERRSQPPTPLVAASTARKADRESPAKLNKESQHTPTRPLPQATHTRPLASSKSDPVGPPSSSLSSSSSSTLSAPAASPTKLATSISPPAAPKVPPKLPHVDDIAANLARLKQARQSRT